MRLYYSGEVVRYEPVKAGRQSELHQMGLEHLGGEARAADAEVLAIAAESLECLGARGWVLALGHVGVFSGLVEGSGLEGERLEALRERVESKDAAGVRGALEGAGLAPATAAALERLTAMGGGLEALEEAARAFAFCPPAARAVDELRERWRAPCARRASPRAWPWTSARCGASTTTPASSSASSRPTSASRSAAAGATTRSSRGSAGRCPRSASCSASTAWRSSSSGRGRRLGRRAPPRRRSTARDLGAALAEARARRASGARVRFGNGGAK